MSAPPVARLTAVATAAAAFAIPTAAHAADPSARAYSLNAAGTSLLSYELGAPGTTTSTPIVNTTAGDVLVGVAVRPQTGALYALGVNEATDTARLYLVGTKTGFSTAIGAAGAQFVDGGGNPIQLSAAANYGLAFNPQADRVRVVSGSLNLRLNPNTGAGVDGDTVATGLNPDGAINGATTNVDSTGYVNRRQSTTITTQYSVSAATGELFRQVPPNAGTTTAPITFKLDGAAYKPAAVSGLDFLPSVSAPAINAPATGNGYLAIVRNGVTELSTVDVTSGELKIVGKIGDGAPVRGLAILGEEAAGGIPAVALSGTTLGRFNTATPATVTTQALTGTTAGEAIVGLTRRPQKGQFIALGINASTDTGTLYVADPQTGALTVIGSAGQIAFTTDGATPVDLPDPAVSSYGVDVNPTVDRIRVVTTTGLNFRLNPDTGAAVDGNNGGAAVGGINPDGAINGLPAGSTGLSATSYTNAFAQGLTGGVTTQYGLDPASNALFIQNPPNVGTQTAQKTVTLAGSPLDFSARSGFDIASDVAVTTSGSTATGVGYGAFSVGGQTSLYTVDLSTGAATLKGALAAGGAVDSLAVGEPTPPLAPVVVPPTTPGPTPPGPTPGTNQPTPDTIAPTLTALRLSPKSFRTGKRPKGASKKVKTGTRISLSLSEPATIAFTVERVESGRRSGKSCKAPTKKNRKAKKCTRYVRVGSFSATGKAGTNSIAWNGKIGKKALKKANYRVTAVATDSAKLKSAARTAKFTVVR